MKDTTHSDINELIIKQMADAMIYSNSKGMIDGWNPAAEALFGYRNDEAIGQSLDLIIPEHLRDAHWTGFNLAMASGSTKNRGRAAITRSLTKTRGTIYVEMSFAVVADREGNTIGSVAVARDATQRHKSEREQRERLRALEELNRRAG